MLLLVAAAAVHADKWITADMHVNYNVQIPDDYFQNFSIQNAAAPNVETPGDGAMSREFPQFNYARSGNLIGFFDMWNPARWVVWAPLRQPMDDLQTSGLQMDGIPKVENLILPLTQISPQPHLPGNPSPSLTPRPFVQTGTTTPVGGVEPVGIPEPSFALLFFAVLGCYAAKSFNAVWLSRFPRAHAARRAVDPVQRRFGKISRRLPGAPY